MSKVIEIYSDENFDVKVEEQEGIMFLHCDVENFNKSVLKQMKAVMEEIKVAAFCHGWDEIFSYTPNPKFAKMLGGESIDSFRTNNQDYEVMRWALEF